MALETGTYLGDLNPANPGGADPKSQGDDHIRLLKTVLKNTFPNITGPMPVAHDQVASKTDIANAQFSSSLPSQPGGAITYNLTSTGGAASWQTAKAIYDDPARLAQAHAISLCF